MASQKAVIRHAQEDMKAIGPETAVAITEKFLGQVQGLDVRQIRFLSEMLVQKTAQGRGGNHALNRQANAYVPYGVGQHVSKSRGRGCLIKITFVDQ